MITNSALNPNAFLKAFYTDTVLVKDNVLFNGVQYDPITNVPSTIIANVYDWYDTAFVTGKSIVLPAYTKKALLRVLVPEGVIAPKYIAFANLHGAPFLLDALVDPKKMALLEGSEIEIYGFNEIKKLILFNNRSNVVGGVTTLHNATPIAFLLNITLYK